jgi:hypothetical protein
MKIEFISSFRGTSEYRVPGLPGRCSVRYLTADEQSLLEHADPQLVGTVVSGGDPVSLEVIQNFQSWLDGLVSSLPELRDRYVKQLTTAKWYPQLGWVRCEPELVD